MDNLQNKYVSLNSITAYREKHNEEIDAKIDLVRTEINSFEDATEEDIAALFQ